MVDEPFLPPTWPLFLDGFCSDLQEDPDGGHVLVSWAEERCVRANVRDDFFARLSDIWQRENRPGSRECIDEAIEPEHQMQRRLGDPGALPQRLSNVSSANRLMRDALREGKLRNASMAESAEFHDLVARNPLVARSYLPSRLRDRQRPTDLVWWTDSDEISEGDANNLRDRLALRGVAYAPCVWLIEIELLRDHVGPCAIPTVLDAAGSNPTFRPQPPESTFGRTVPPSGVSGVREWIGRPVRTDRAQVRARGHIL